VFGYVIGRSGCDSGFDPFRRFHVVDKAFAEPSEIGEQAA